VANSAGEKGGTDPQGEKKEGEPSIDSSPSVREEKKGEERGRRPLLEKKE